MILYKFTVTTTASVIAKLTDYDEESVFSKNPISQKNSKYNKIYSVDKKYKITITDIQDDKIIFAVAIKYEVNVAECKKVISDSISDIVDIKFCDITIDDYKREIKRAYGNKWLSDSADSIIHKLGLRIEPSDYSYDSSRYTIVEKVYTAENYGDNNSYAEKFENILASDNVRDEIARICSDENEKEFYGHPVHYYLTVGDKESAGEIIDILIPALLENKRLLSGRVCHVKDIAPNAYKEDNFDNIFSSSQGATVVINLSNNENENNFAYGYHILAEKLGEKLKKYGNNTLFIFVDISENRSMSSDTVAAILANADMIQLTDGCGNFKQAVKYLERLAEKTTYKNYSLDELTQYLPKDKVLYSVSDIYGAYHHWYGNGLKTHVYKAYKENDIATIVPNKKKDDPYEELQKMVGLSDVKKITDQIISVFKMQKIRKEMGLSAENMSMHMLFSGNPGTAKTTVARLLAQILKQEEILNNGHIVECGRQDLVGKYVGWTAKIVEDKFRAARGGILFIDEAYSLVEDGRTYGAEAINTIVQLMENYRGETIVIFAGYPDKMKSFIEQNEGLASRIAFHLDFPDYTSDELLSILKLMLEKQGYNTDENALKKCLSIFSEVCKTKNFGNGRFVRNLLEHAIMHQSDRLIKNDTAKLSKNEISALIAEDFEMMGLQNNINDKKIGFNGIDTL